MSDRTTELRSILDDAIDALRRSPHIVLESAVVLPPRTSDSLEALEARSGVRLAPSAVDLYTQLGGAHISWRLAAAGYEKLDPDRVDSEYRYDISGNIDLLAPEELAGGLSDQPWEQILGGHAKGYRPLDFSSVFVSCGVVTPGGPGGLVLSVVYDRRLAPLGLTLAEYLPSGARLLFMDDWQLTLLTDGPDPERCSRLEEIRAQLSRLTA